MTSHEKSAEGYQAPALKVLGPVAALTQACSGKRLGGSDTFIFRGQLVCTSGSG
jgi:hypothetical protein